MSIHACLDLLCESVLSMNSSIQSVAVLSKMGRLIEESSRPGFAKRNPHHRSEHFLMQCALQVSMDRDFDETYGPIDYHISERASLTMLTFPTGENIVLVTCKKNPNPTALAKKIIEGIGRFKNRQN